MAKRNGNHCPRRSALAEIGGGGPRGLCSFLETDGTAEALERLQQLRILCALRHRAVWGRESKPDGEEILVDAGLLARRGGCYQGNRA